MKLSGRKQVLNKVAPVGAGLRIGNRSNTRLERNNFNKTIRLSIDETPMPQERAPVQMAFGKRLFLRDRKSTGLSSRTSINGRSGSKNRRKSSCKRNNLENPTKMKKSSSTIQQARTTKRRLSKNNGSTKRRTTRRSVENAGHDSLLARNNHSSDRQSGFTNQAIIENLESSQRMPGNCFQEQE